MAIHDWVGTHGVAQHKNPSSSIQTSIPSLPSTPIALEKQSVQRILSHVTTIPEKNLPRLGCTPTLTAKGYSSDDYGEARSHPNEVKPRSLHQSAQWLSAWAKPSTSSSGSFFPPSSHTSSPNISTGFQSSVFGSSSSSLVSTSRLYLFKLCRPSQPIRS